MELTRTIHPIGQGGFYSESFTETMADGSDYEIFNVIYDCGSETGNDTINKYLGRYIPNSMPKKRINAVFISHLHNDHVNGLDYLLSNANVTYLFLPQMTADVVIEAYLYNCIKSGGTSNTANLCISKLLQNEYNNVKIVQIKELNEDEQFYRKENDSILIDNDGVLWNQYDSGTVFTITPRIHTQGGKAYKWLYIPFNSPFKSKKGRISRDPFFASALDTNGEIDYQLMEKIVESCPTEDIRELYSSYFGDKYHNSYSMTLFSGIEDPEVSDCVSIRCNNIFCRCHCFDHTPNFLYTGDFEPNRKAGKNTFVELMKKRLESLNLWDTISGIQVPHHGSRNNFNNELYHCPCVGYISAGSKNRHGHPNVDTLINIRKNGCNPIIVSEDLSSMQVEVYKMR